MWDFLKKLSKKDEKKAASETASPVKGDAPRAAITPSPDAAQPVQAAKPQAEAKPKEKFAAEKSDEELAADLEKMSPGLLSHAKNPQMKKMIIDIYRKMLVDGVDVNNEKEVKKWLKNHPEMANGGEEMPKIETFRREEPKIGRNDPCPCGSGKKYKKCCADK